MELRPGQEADKDRSKRLWDMEEKKTLCAAEEKKVTSMYLIGDAKENLDGAGRTA